MTPAERALKELTGLTMGQEVTIRAKITGLVDFGRTIQLLLSDNNFIYIPVGVVEAAINEQ